MIIPVLNSNEIQKKLNENTLDEVIQMVGMSKTKFCELVKTLKLKILYKHRTPITKQLIPINSMISKEMDKKTTATDYTDVSLPWKQHEIDMRKKCKDEASLNAGALLFKIEQDIKILNDYYKEIAYQDFIINVIQSVKVGDIIGVMSEEQYGKYDIPEKINEYSLNNEIMLSYITAKYGLVKALKIKEILESEK